MYHPLEDCHLKVARAKEQVNSLRDEVLKVSEENPVEITGSVNRKTGEREFQVPQLPRWPAQWTVVVGEIGHNLRSALDYLVFQLAADPEKNRTAFPISEKERDYLRPRGRRKISYRDNCLAGVDAKWAAWIDQLQPFNGPFPPAGASELALLNALSNRDKHRTRVPCYTVIEIPSAFVIIDGPDFVRNLKLRETADGKVSIGQEFSPAVSAVRGDRMLMGVDPKREPNSKVGIDIALTKRRFRLPQLAMIVSHVEFIIDSVYPAFDPVSRSD